MRSHFTTFFGIKFEGAVADKRDAPTR